jgi:hypothetical protein
VTRGRRAPSLERAVTISRQPPHPSDEHGREDDWLADEGGIDWSTDPRPHEDEVEWPQQSERARPAGLVRAPAVRDGTASEAVLRRRRLLAIGAVAVAIVIAIIVAVVAANGGSGGSAETTVATPVTPQTPAETTTEATTTSGSSAPAEVTVPASGHLSAGDSGPAVETLQQALKQLGLYNGAVDGDFGQGTSDAVVAFQNAHNLTPDGIVGQATADAINQALAQSVG